MQLQVRARARLRAQVPQQVLLPLLELAQVRLRALLLPLELAQAPLQEPVLVPPSLPSFQRSRRAQVRR